MSPKKPRLFVQLMVACLFISIGFWAGYKIAQAPRTDFEKNQLRIERELSKPTKQVKVHVSPEAPKPRVVERKPKPPKALVAIVLDDWGYNLNAYDYIAQIQAPLNFAILPHLPYSRSIAREAYESGHEVLLHMPMEPKRSIPLEDSALLMDMSEDEISKRLVEATENIPYLRGVSNHMGSKLTSNYSSMYAVLKVIQREGYYFFDSLVTQDSVCSRIAGDLAMPFVSRDVFLDNERDAEYILEQLGELRRIALRQGYAIGIGHDEAITLKAIQSVIPHWQAEGIRFAKLSDIINFKKRKEELISRMQKVL